MIRDFDYYDNIIVSYSGGKDSTACALLMAEYNIPVEKVWLWHQSIDGREDTVKHFFDWPSTEGYCEKFSDHVKMKLEYQWRAYGFHGEMFRENERSKDVFFTHDQGTTHLPTTKGKNTTRRMFPAKQADLRYRWCSGTLKIDVSARAITNHPELQGKRILFITGERREESSARSKYLEAELHRTNSKSRLVHHWRPVIDWEERKVWDIMERNRINPHPAYYLGFPRLSCRSCIFYSNNHWATLNEVEPGVVKMIAELEHELGFTLDNKFTMNEMVEKGKSLLKPENKSYIEKAVTFGYHDDVYTKDWELPVGAFGSGGGAV